MTLRALVSGYYGYGNAGDEAVLAGMIEALKAHGTLPVVISGDPAATEALHGVRAVGRSGPRALARELGRADLLISGGGGLIQDRTSRRSALYYLGVIGLARALGVGTYLYAQGVGPVTTRTVRAAARLVLPGVLGAGARDEASARTLVDLGVDPDRVRVTADAAFALPPVDREEAERALASAGVPGGGPRIGLIWRPPVARRRRPSLLARLPERRPPAAEDRGRSLAPGRTAGGRGQAPEGAGPAGIGRLGETLATAAGRWAKETSGVVVVIPLHPAQDAAASRRLAGLAAAEGGRVHAVLGPLDFRSARAVISALDIVVSVRYHGVLFAAAGGVPCVGVAYDPKVEALSGTLGVEALPLSAGASEVRDAILRAWENGAELKERLRRKADELRKRAIAEGGRPREIVEGTVR